MVLTGDVWRISDVRSEHLHFHNCVEIGICESDSGIMELGDRTLRFKEGDITMIGRDVPHTTYSDKGTASKWSYVFIDVEEFLAPYFPLSRFINPDDFGSMLRNYAAIFDCEKYAGQATLVKELVSELASAGEHYRLYVGGLVLSLFTFFYSEYKTGLTTLPDIDDASLMQNQQEKNRLPISPALDYIHMNYNHDFPMEQLAAICHISPTHFRRQFHAILGMGPLEYLNHVRVTKASILLASTDMPVLTISEEVGFGSVSSLNRHFAAELRTTPLKWRRERSYIDNQSVLKYSGWLVPDSM